MNEEVLKPLMKVCRARPYQRPKLAEEPRRKVRNAEEKVEKLMEICESLELRTAVPNEKPKGGRRKEAEAFQ